MKNKLLNFLFTISCLISTYYLLGLGYYNSFILDDYGIISSVEKTGIFTFVKDIYMTWQGRFSSFFLTASLFKLFATSENLIVFTLFQLVIGYVCVFILMKWIFSDLKILYLCFMTILFVNFSIVGIFAFSTFYWSCATVYILINFITILLVYCIFNKANCNFYGWFFILILSILIGGFAEVYTPLLILSFGAIFLYKIFKQGWSIFWKDNINTRLFFSIFILFICFVIQLLSPGNKIRMDAITSIHPTGISLLVKSIRAMIDLMFFISSKIIYPIIFFPICFWIGFKLKNSEIIFLKNFKVTYKQVILSIIVLFIFLFIAIVPGVYAVGAIAPIRSLSFISFVIMTFAAFWGVIYGYNTQKKANSLFVYMFIVNVFIITIFSWKIIDELPRAKTYKHEILLREKILLGLQKREFHGVAIVKPINVNYSLTSKAIIWNMVMYVYKPSKMTKEFYFPYEIFSVTTDTKEWRNQGLKSYLKLDYEILGYDTPEKYAKKPDKENR